MTQNKVKIDGTATQTIAHDEMDRYHIPTVIREMVGSDQQIVVVDPDPNLPNIRQNPVGHYAYEFVMTSLDMLIAPLLGALGFENDPNSTTVITDQDAVDQWDEISTTAHPVELDTFADVAIDTETNGGVLT